MSGCRVAAISCRRSMFDDFYASCRRRMIIIPPNAVPPRRRNRTPESMGRMIDRNLLWPCSPDHNCNMVSNGPLRVPTGSKFPLYSLYSHRRPPCSFHK